MAANTIMVDTSILIDYYRKTDKNKSVWISLVRRGFGFAISAITKYEIYSGATPNQLEFWDNILLAIENIPLDEASIDVAVVVNTRLKQGRQQIALADLLIAASAISNQMPLATLNKKHFERIDTLQMVD
ncbi:MAG: type II toxin-antitoxin system VapC family toxin [Dyadobacter sp.]|uniref:type II toxin-antitoxin system VapC family toxin n=1 Tax=Dyadobacter sp. TaxID=1914288 RepID=UPI0032664984